MTRLSDAQIQNRLAAADGWRRDGNSICKTYALPSFPAALVFVGAVGHLAEVADHHPDISVNYRKVSLTLSTHSAGGLTDKDFDLAAQIDSMHYRSDEVKL